MLFGKKKLNDYLIKYFNDKKISYEMNDDSTISFTISFKEFSIYPYVKDSNDGKLSVLINIKKIDNKNVNQALDKINKFNLNSNYFAAKLKDDILLLEYNTIIDGDVSNYLDTLIDSITYLKDEIIAL